MIHFAWPFVFLLLPLPFIARRLPGQAGRENSAAIKVPFFAEIKTSFITMGIVAAAVNGRGQTANARKTAKLYRSRPRYYSGAGHFAFNDTAGYGGNGEKPAGRR